MTYLRTSTAARLLPLVAMIALTACGGAAPAATASPAPTPPPIVAPPTVAPPTAAPAPASTLPPTLVAPPTRLAVATVPPASATQTVAALQATLLSPGMAQTAAAIARVTPGPLLACPSLLSDAEVGGVLGAAPTLDLSPAAIGAVAAQRPELRAACVWTVRGARKGAILTVSVIPATGAPNPATDPALTAGSGVTGTAFTPVTGLGENARWVTVAARPETGLLIFYKGSLGMSLSLTGASLDGAKTLATLILARLPAP
jgi:hypothetical protein